MAELGSRYLDEYLSKIGACLEWLSEEQVWWRPAPGTNSIGNLMLHLAGNLTLWILGGLGGQPVERDRSGEFAAQRSHDKAQLWERLEGVVRRCQAVLRDFPEERLARRCPVQGYEVDGLGVLFHAVEHMAYHTGQIVWAAKQSLMDGAAIEFYPQHRGE